MKEKLYSKGIIRDILSQRKFALQLIGRGKDYNCLLEYLLSKDYYYEDDLIWPNLKSICKELKINYSVIRRMLNQIYMDLLNIYENKINYSINEADYIFYLKFLDYSAEVKLQNIPSLPRIGEIVELPFFREMVHTTSFFVRSIDHCFTDDKQIVYIYLEVGEYNLYWKLFTDEKYLKSQLSYDEYRFTPEYKLREKFHFRGL